MKTNLQSLKSVWFKWHTLEINLSVTASQTDVNTGPDYTDYVPDAAIEELMDKMQK